MRPYVLSGHTRPLTSVVYNADGDILVTACKGGNINVSSSKDGRMLGSYQHESAVNDVAIDPTSRFVVSGAANFQAHVWNLMTGVGVANIAMNSPVFAVDFARDAPYMLVGCGGKMGQPSAVHIFRFDADEMESGTLCFEDPVAVLYPSETDTAATIARFGLRDFVYMGHENGCVTSWSVASAAETADGTLTASMVQFKHFNDAVTDICVSADRAFVVASSKDHTARLMTPTLESLRVFKTQRPVNSIALCPLRNHVILGGGQDAQSVTTTQQSSGKFESRFYHTVFNQEFARVKGHYGPINKIAVHPFNESFATGAEEGRVRLHHFDKSYFDFKLIPQETFDAQI